MLDRAHKNLSSDAELLSLTSNTTVSFALSDRSGQTLTVCVQDSSVTTDTSTTNVDPDFTVVLDDTEWDSLLSPSPEPRHQHVLAFIAPRGTGEVVGDRESFAQHLHLLRRVVEVLRGSEATTVAAVPSLESVTGRYVRIDHPEWGRCNIYFEGRGAGRPVILLPTAGSDTSQYHGVMSDDTLASDYRLIAFDLPWHGKSMPPASSLISDYHLTTKSYTDCIRAFIDALRLDEKPVIVGPSMAGAVVVEMLALHPDSLRGAISCQAGPRVGNRHTPWLRNPKVNQTLHVPEWTFGLMSPTSPKADRNRVWWGYSLGGYGVYERDIDYYSTDWDIDNIAHLFTDTTPPTVLLNGVYDYSVPPEQTRELAARIPRSIYREMSELGHFPHAENPPAFVRHLQWALDWINQRTS